MTTMYTVHFITCSQMFELLVSFILDEFEFQSFSCDYVSNSTYLTENSHSHKYDFKN